MGGTQSYVDQPSPVEFHPSVSLNGTFSFTVLLRIFFEVLLPVSTEFSEVTKRTTLRGEAFENVFEKRFTSPRGNTIFTALPKDCVACRSHTFPFCSSCLMGLTHIYINHRFQMDYYWRLSIARREPYVPIDVNFLKNDSRERTRYSRLRVRSFQ